MVFKRISSLFGGSKELPELPFEARINPDGPFYVIGDIHGCLELLNTRLAEIETDKSSDAAKANAPIVFIGDFIDRGQQSADVLKLLHQRCLQDPEQNICIIGNHEKMMLEFLDDPAGNGRRWLRFGGLDTLKSFGITGASEKMDLEDLVDVSSDLENSLGAELQSWLRDMPKIWSTGNVHCVHAGLDPNKPISAQRSSTMIWGHPEFSTKPREDGQWVVHGHTIVPKPASHSGRVATDTGAYKTGKLTVAAISEGSVRFL